MRNYMNPEMNISKFSVTDVVTTSGGYTEDPAKTNAQNAQEYLKSKNIDTTNILSFN